MSDRPRLVVTIFPCPQFVSAALVISLRQRLEYMTPDYRGNKSPAKKIPALKDWHWKTAMKSAMKDQSWEPGKESLVVKAWQLMSSNRNLAMNDQQWKLGNECQAIKTWHWTTSSESLARNVKQWSLAIHVKKWKISNENLAKSSAMKTWQKSPAMKAWQWNRGNENLVMKLWQWNHAGVIKVPKIGKRVYWSPVVTCLFGWAGDEFGREVLRPCYPITTLAGRPRLDVMKPRGRHWISSVRRRGLRWNMNVRDHQSGDAIVSESASFIHSRTIFAT